MHAYRAGGVPSITTLVIHPLPPCPAQCVQLDVALGMWKLLLSGDRDWPLVDDWCEFLQATHAGRAVSKDAWSQLLDFIQVNEWGSIRG